MKANRWNLWNDWNFWNGSDLKRDGDFASEE